MPRTGFWSLICEAVRRKDGKQALFYLTALVGEKNKLVMLEECEEQRRNQATPAICVLAARKNGLHAGICATVQLPPPVNLIVAEAQGDA
jgi:hypothetical protein